MGTVWTTQNHHHAESDSARWQTFCSSATFSLNLKFSLSSTTSWLRFRARSRSSSRLARDVTSSSRMSMDRSFLSAVISRQSAISPLPGLVGFKASHSFIMTSSSSVSSDRMLGLVIGDDPNICVCLGKSRRHRLQSCAGVSLLRMTTIRAEVVSLRMRATNSAPTDWTLMPLTSNRRSPAQGQLETLGQLSQLRKGNVRQVKHNKSFVRNFGLLKTTVISS